MADLKSTTIIPIAIYCFGLGVYFLSLTANSLMGHTVDLSNADLDIWLPLIVFGFLGVYFIAVGAGVLNVSNWSWKVLFFSLAICVSSMASLLIVFIIFLFIDIKFLDPYFKNIQTTSVEWFSFLAVFLSEIIVLYYLTREEIVASFGGMGDLISPF